MLTSAAPHRWALIASVLVGVLGLQWWLLPETSPFGTAGAGAAAAGAVIVSTTGVVTALAYGSRLGPAGRRMAVAAAAAQSLVLAVAGLDITVRMVDDGVDRVGLPLLHVLGAVAVGALWLAVALPPTGGSQTPAWRRGQIAKHAGVSRNMPTPSGPGP